MDCDYDSRADTLDHINKVQGYIGEIISWLLLRAQDHDRSKLASPEKEAFDRMTPRLSNCEYGSQEYREALGEIKTALAHHYQQNSHHPEHYNEGIYGMDLIDLIEMICDWKAANRRNPCSNMMRSLATNVERHEIPSPLASILKNTIRKMRW